MFEWNCFLYKCRVIYHHHSLTFSFSFQVLKAHQAKQYLNLVHLVLQGPQVNLAHWVFQVRCLHLWRAFSVMWLQASAFARWMSWNCAVLRDRDLVKTWVQYISHVLTPLDSYKIQNQLFDLNTFYKDWVVSQHHLIFLLSWNMFSSLVMQTIYFWNALHKETSHVWKGGDKIPNLNRGGSRCIGPWSRKCFCSNCSKLGSLAWINFVRLHRKLNVPIQLAIEGLCQMWKWIHSKVQRECWV